MATSLNWLSVVKSKSTSWWRFCDISKPFFLGSTSIKLHSSPHETWKNNTRTQFKHYELIFQLWKNHTKTINIQSMMNFTIYICLESSPTYGLIIYSHFMGSIKILRHAISDIYGTFGHKKNKKWFFNFLFCLLISKNPCLQRLFT